MNTSFTGLSVKTFCAMILSERQREFLPKYERMRKVGGAPHILYRVMQHDGFQGLACMQLLRTLIPGLSLGEAKEVMIEVDTGLSLSEYQGRLADEIEAVLKEDSEYI